MHYYYLLTFPFNNEVVSSSDMLGALKNMEPLDGSNYHSWKESIEVLMAFANCDYVVLEDEPKEPEKNEEDYC